MKRIFKYPLTLVELQAVELPRGAAPLSVAWQSGRIVLWALVDDNEPLVTRGVYVVGTGNAVPKNIGEFIGTVLEGIDGFYVWHCFWEREK